MKGLFSMRTPFLLCTVLALAMAAPACSKYKIRDIDPGKAGKVRTLGPESQDVLALSDKMVRSLLASKVIAAQKTTPTIVMLPMVNNTRYAFNQEVFTSKLKSQLNKDAEGKLLFVSRDIAADVQAERELKRAGEVDYDPDLRATTPAGADYFIKGYANGLAAVSTEGQADYITYTFKLVNAETSIELWEEDFDTKKEGKDDVIYR